MRLKYKKKWRYNNMELLLKNNQILTIREAKADDARELNDFMRAIIVETEQFGLELDEFNMTDEQQEFTIGMFLKADNAILIVATLDNKIVGNLSFRAGGTKKFRHVGELGVQVLKQYWGLGIGKELINFLIKWAKESGIIKKISLRVRTDNDNAISLYRKLGFQQEGILRNEFMCNCKLYDLMYMGFEID
jgi:RimJ/RimL family protein N-acetyltransferase